MSKSLSKQLDCLIKDMRAEREKLNRENRAIFAYLYSLITDLSYPDIYQMEYINYLASKNKRYLDNLYKFSVKQGIVNSRRGLLKAPVEPELMDDYLSSYSDKCFIAPFYFTTNEKRSNALFNNTITTSFLKPNGEIFKIDEEASSKMVLALKQNGITPLRGIVEGGYRFLANDDVDDYISSLKNIKKPYIK